MLRSLVSAVFTCVLLAAPSPLSAFDGNSSPDGHLCRLLFPTQSNKTEATIGEKPSGMFADLVTKIFSDAGVPMEAAPYAPWPRSVALVSRGRYDGLAIAMKDPEREDAMLFVGPFLERSWSAFHMKDHSPPPGGHATIGVPNRFGRLAPIKEAVALSGGRPVEMPMARLTRMLVENRVDMVLSTDIGIMVWARQHGVEVEKIEGTTARIPAFIALMKSSPCAAHHAKLQSSMNRWIASGGRQAFLRAFDQGAGIQSVRAGSRVIPNRR